MTVDEFVALTHARKARGRSEWKWEALCPAHGDNHPSLGIKEGRKGVIVSCRSHHCSVKSICAALGITVESLFYDSGRRLSRREVEEMRQKEALCAQEARQRARVRRVALRKAGMWEEAANRLGGLLMRYPHSDRLARLFRVALANSRRCEAVADAFDHPWLRGKGFPRYRFPLTRKGVGSKIAWSLGIKA